MKQLALAAAVLALLSVAANAQVGKGKAPPPPPVRDEGVTLVRGYYGGAGAKPAPLPF